MSDKEESGGKRAMGSPKKTDLEASSKTKDGVSRKIKSDSEQKQPKAKAGSREQEETQQSNRPPGPKEKKNLKKSKEKPLQENIISSSLKQEVAAENEVSGQTPEEKPKDPEVEKVKHRQVEMDSVMAQNPFLGLESALRALQSAEDVPDCNGHDVLPPRVEDGGESTERSEHAPETTRTGSEGELPGAEAPREEEIEASGVSRENEDLFANHGDSSTDTGAKAEIGDILEEGKDKEGKAGLLVLEQMGDIHVQGLKRRREEDGGKKREKKKGKRDLKDGREELGQKEKPKKEGAPRKGKSHGKSDAPQQSKAKRARVGAKAMLAEDGKVEKDRKGGCDHDREEEKGGSVEEEDHAQKGKDELQPGQVEDGVRWAEGATPEEPWASPRGEGKETEGGKKHVRAEKAPKSQKEKGQEGKKTKKKKREGGKVGHEKPPRLESLKEEPEVEKMEEGERRGGEKGVKEEEEGEPERGVDGGIKEECEGDGLGKSESVESDEKVKVENGLEDEKDAKTKAKGEKPAKRRKAKEENAPKEKGKKASEKPEKEGPAQKRKTTEEGDKKKSKKAKTEENEKEKKKKEEESKWKWWEEEKTEDKVKWKQLEHKGPYFAPLYEPLPDDVKFYYDGQPMKLSLATEEIATFYAKMLDHEYTTKEMFQNNFFRDWKEEMTEKEQEIIQSLDKCDFKEIHKYFVDRNEARKALPKEEKQKLKEETDKIQEEYGYCILDGHREKIGNFKTEPPGLFRGRGNHPKMGMLKKRIMPEDVIINCSKDSKIPVPPEGHKWKEVRCDNTVTWLASWTENIQNSLKYIMLNPSSKLKGEKDWQKYEVARRLKGVVDKIRSQYRDDWKSREMKTRQRAVALYFIDKLALRAGNEKEEGETADTVGCCSLRVEHIKLHPELDEQEHVVEFDFLGKDSIRYYNKVPVEKPVFKNLKLFMQNKDPGDDLFDRLTTSSLNSYLQDLMAGLSAKVFRTYNASITLQEQLKALTNPEDNVAAKLLAYNRANRAVAVLCNHQRATPKTFEKSMQALQAKIDAKNQQLEDAQAELKRAKADRKAKKDVKSKEAVEKKKKLLEKIKEQLEKLNVQVMDKEENKQIALGTSKLNYLDPRISVAWCKKFGVPIEKIYNKTQREKFAWAIDMADEDFEF
ncbi:DNA topoisomerase I, mitochondrial isoform X2 [Alligator mississippiensis]|uniref:DNA topoisomerase I, mitochondrial isoform X2 n=1 Tax=Alligator mississippiensis TaxID=8496 RepID=UPI002877626D|nr:DNA topoisomerase I, mitochondrial isoform X2 [Alligator mississippiensis]